MRAVWFEMNILGFFPEQMVMPKNFIILFFSLIFKSPLERDNQKNRQKLQQKVNLILRLMTITLAISLFMTINNQVLIV